MCGLERRRIVTLPPDRETATIRAWLSKHPTINIVSRDPGGEYGETAAKALLNAIQVADHWHLMENASVAFLDAVRPLHEQNPNRNRSDDDQPGIADLCGKLRYQGYLRRQDSRAVITASSATV